MRPTRPPRCRGQLPPAAVKVFARRIPTSLLGGRAGPERGLHAQGLADGECDTSFESSVLPLCALMTKPQLPSVVGVPVSRPCGERARPGGSAPIPSTTDACTSVPVGGFRVVTCLAVSVSRYRAGRSSARLTDLVVDLESGVDVDAELALGSDPRARTSRARLARRSGRDSRARSASESGARG